MVRASRVDPVPMHTGYTPAPPGTRRSTASTHAPPTHTAGDRLGSLLAAPVAILGRLVTWPVKPAPITPLIGTLMTAPGVT